ncbi:MAG: ribonuclease Z [Methanobacteriaceae archaeon]|nr:ribonuclease Z [Methanobacteriaceae archaeon]
MEITFLGTSSAVPTKHRNHTAITLKAFGEVMLFDCGEGTQRQLIEAKISPMKIDKIFITHYHGDHILGLAGLIQSIGFRGRTKDLDIYGPKGLVNLINAITQLGYFQINYNINIHEISDGIILETDKYTVEAVKAEHNLTNMAYSVCEKKKPRFLREKAISLGVKPGPLFGKLHNGETVEVDGKIIKPEQVLGPKRTGKKFTYSGDTRPCPQMIELAKDSDILIHESTYQEADKEHAIENAHSTTKEAATIGIEANVKQLVLTHISTRYKEDEILKKEAEEVFEGAIIAYDYLTITI